MDLPHRRKQGVKVVSIQKACKGKCLWCQKEADGVQAKFQDGLTGFFCRKHFWEAIEARSEKEEGDAPASGSSGKAT